MYYQVFKASTVEINSAPAMQLGAYKRLLSDREFHREPIFTKYFSHIENAILVHHACLGYCK